jgi:predicted ATP-binding protein involved in virulence
LSAYDEILPQINRVDFEEWLVRDTGERIGIQEVLERYSEYLPIRSGKPAKVEPEWYKNLRESLDVRFIQTQRLFAMENSRERMQQRTDSRSPAVKQYSDELAKEIQSTLARYGSRSQELDRTFPSRLFQQTSATTLSAEELMKRFEKIEDQRSLLTRLGFLEAESVMTPIPQQGSDEKRDVLSVYIQDVEHKFSIFDELAAKIEFLTNIVNRRFLYKKLSISKDTGFVFRMDNETPLSPIDLSSGEQHELVLLYELLFKVKPNSLLLIDEPEISLHMGWQEEFLGDLQRAVELSGFDVLVATHAAGIIGDRWDLTVELQGPTR